MTHLNAVLEKYANAQNVKTMSELARLANISASNLSELRSGKRPLSKDMARKLAEVLVCDFEELLRAARLDQSEPKAAARYTVKQLRFFADVTEALSPYIQEPYSQELLMHLWRERKVRL